MRLKYVFLSFMIMCVAACGFTPVYDTQNVAGELSQVTVRPIPEREGQLLRNNLLDRGFGTLGGGDIDLAMGTLDVSEIDLGISSDNTSTRRQITVTGQLRLMKKETVILDRLIVARTTYNVLLSQFGTNVSRDNALDLAINDMARQIETQTLLTLKAQP